MLGLGVKLGIGVRLGLGVRLALGVRVRGRVRPKLVNLESRCTHRQLRIARVDSKNPIVVETAHQMPQMQDDSFCLDFQCFSLNMYFASLTFCFLQILL